MNQNIVPSQSILLGPRRFPRGPQPQPGLPVGTRLLQPAFTGLSGVNVGGEPCRRLMIVFRTNGCAFFRAGHACTMCGFHLHAVDSGMAQVRERHLIRQYESALECANHAVTCVRQIDLLTLGSFLDDQEIPPSFRRAVLERISGLPNVGRVVIESRAEYVDRAELSMLKACLRPDQILELGIGVESSNDEIRNRILRKGLSWAQLERVVGACAECGVVFQPYLFIKPPGLNEHEAIEDAMQSAEDITVLACKYGAAFRLAFQPAFVVPGTPLERTYLAGEYRVVNLWSVVEIVRHCHNLGTVFVGTSDEGLSDGRIPQSCIECSSALRAALDRYNAYQDLGAFDYLDCPCKTRWESELKQEGGLVCLAISNARNWLS